MLGFQSMTGVYDGLYSSVERNRIRFHPTELPEQRSNLWNPTGWELQFADVDCPPWGEGYVGECWTIPDEACNQAKTSVLVRARELEAAQCISLPPDGGVRQGQFDLCLRERQVLGVRDRTRHREVTVSGTCREESGTCRRDQGTGHADVCSMVIPLPNGLRLSCGLRRPQTSRSSSLRSGRRGPTASSAC